MRSPARMTAAASSNARCIRPLLATMAACIVLMLSGCSGSEPPVSQTVVVPAGPSSPAPAEGAAREMVVYAPSTTSSVPIILATRELTLGTGSGEAARLTIFSNHSQANTLFLRDEVDILVTGLSVGIGLFRNGAPVQAINCNVSGLTYLVTYGRSVNSLAELGGDPLYVPFEGSPIEETSHFFAEREGLSWREDIRPVYAASDSTLALLKQGQAAAAALPEPYVSLAEQQPEIKVSFSYRDRWDKLTGSDQGYPQVCAFVMKPWADTHGEAIARFNEKMASAVATVRRDPVAAGREVVSELGFSEEILASALARTDFTLLEGEAMAGAIRRYYETVGKPLDESYAAFFYAP